MRSLFGISKNFAMRSYASEILSRPPIAIGSRYATRPFSSTAKLGCAKRSFFDKNRSRCATCLPLPTTKSNGVKQMPKLLIGVAKHTELLENYKIYTSPSENDHKHMYLIEDIYGFKTGLYQHYKGKKYLVLGVAKENLTLVPHVIYVCLYDNELSSMWARPKDMFTENIEQNGIVVPRFKYIISI
jgi:hypothetical protein